MYRRNIQDSISAALKDTPVVLIHGGRQTGKTTLAANIGRGRRTITFDDPTLHASAKRDPAGFVDALHGPVTIDEVQRVPELFLPIKAAVDRDRTPGRFLLTGSANILALPRLADSLAGRMEIITLHPLSQGEIEGRRETFIDRLFDSDAALPPTGDAPELACDDLHERVVRGGFPSMVARTDAPRRRAWARSYLRAILDRDLRDLAMLDSLASIPPLLSLLASRSGGLLNLSDLARLLALPRTTLNRYYTLLRTLFMVDEIPPYALNLGQRIVKSPRTVVADTGLACNLLNISAARLRKEGRLFGPLLETFVANELRKQIGYSETAPTLHHFRTTAGREVDLVLDSPDGRTIGIEVKASASVHPADFAGLRHFADYAGPDRFVRGIILYRGSAVVHSDERFSAIPMAALWRW